MHYKDTTIDSLKKSQIEILKEEFEDKLLTESVESLDSFLPRIHCKNPEQLEMEHRIVVYLRSKKLEFKTDPRQKELDYYEKQKQSLPILLKQTIGEGHESPEIRSEPQVPLKTYGEVVGKKEFNAWLNPFIQRKQIP